MPVGPTQAPSTFAQNSAPGAELHQPEPTPQWDAYRPASLPSSARGPPCKPRRSESAVWTGNLPPSTTVIQLKDHFSIGAKEDIESVFLITKTNCAFINYKSEATCNRAIERFNNQAFRGKRLVCRLRRNSSSEKASSEKLSLSRSDVSPLSQTSSESPFSEHSTDTSEATDRWEASDAPLIVHGDTWTKNNDTTVTSQTPESPVADFDRLNITPRSPARFFILKSLTLQDLLVSTRDGAWSTQPHNEKKLNEAYRTADNVYLLFSVNKSGEYFGYARMEAPIVSDGPIKAPMSAHHQFSYHTGDAPRFIATLATATAPEGRVIDDSARGTIFWEAKALNAEIEYEHSKGSAGKEKQFAIRWISTTRVPFHATRGLRNPLNKNREIKIARDGTEVDEWVGWRLLQHFNR